MRLTSENLQISLLHTMAVGFSAFSEFSLALDSDEAVIIKRVMASLDPTSGAPATAAAGLSAFQVALSGAKQAVPTDNIASLSRLLALLGTTYIAGAAGSGLSFTYRGEELPLQMPLCRTVQVLGYTANISNAASTIIRLDILYDRYTITSAEKVLLL